MAHSLSAQETTYKGWKSLNVETLCGLRFAVTPEIGGRISGCSYKGKELFYTQPEFEGVVVPSPANLEELKKQKISQGFRVYGGYKTWIAPQYAWPDNLPFFDLDSGSYQWSVEKTKRDLRIQMKSPICRESNLELTKEIICDPVNPFVRITHGMINHGEDSVFFGLWDVSQIIRPAKVYLPLRPCSKLPNGIRVFDCGNKDSFKPEDYVERKEGFIVINCSDSSIFKLGTDAEAGWILGFIPNGDNNWIVFKKTFEVFSGTEYGHGCSAEVFNSDRMPYLEMEIHSSMVKLNPEVRFTWMTYWSFTEVDKLPESMAELETLFYRM